MGVYIGLIQPFHPKPSTLNPEPYIALCEPYRSLGIWTGAAGEVLQPPGADPRLQPSRSLKPRDLGFRV